MPSGISLVSYISDIISVVYVDSCIVFLLPLIGIRDSASTVTISHSQVHTY